MVNVKQEGNCDRPSDIIDNNDGRPRTARSPVRMMKVRFITLTTLTTRKQKSILQDHRKRSICVFFRGIPAHQSSILLLRVRRYTTLRGGDASLSKGAEGDYTTRSGSSSSVRGSVGIWMYRLGVTMPRARWGSGISRRWCVEQKTRVMCESMSMPDAPKRTAQHYISFKPHTLSGRHISIDSSLALALVLSPFSVPFPLVSYIRPFLM